MSPDYGLDRRTTVHYLLHRLVSQSPRVGFVTLNRYTPYDAWLASGAPVARPELKIVPPCRRCGVVPTRYVRFSDDTVEHLIGECPMRNRAAEMMAETPPPVPRIPREDL